MSNTLNPFLSIIIPVYNLEDRITICLESIIHQTNNNFECIIINDGSTDNSLLVIKEFLDNVNHNLDIKIISTENKGVGEARNKGISEYRGDYLYFLDGDDFISRDFTQILFNEAKENPDIESFVFGYSVIDSNQNLKRYFDLYPPCNRELTGINLLHKISLKESWVSTLNIMYSRKFISDNNSSFKNYISGQDIHFNYMNILLLKKVLLIDKELSFYMHREGSITKSFNIHKFDAFNMRLDLISHIENIETLKEKKWLKNFFVHSLLVSFLQIYNSFLINKYNSKNINKQLSLRYPDILNNFKMYLKIYSGKDKFKLQIFYLAIKLHFDRLYKILITLYSMLTKKNLT